MTRARFPDPVTFEIIRHKLHQVIDEAILALERVSGSPTTAEAHDMMVSLYRADGSLMVGGVGFLHHLPSAAQAVRHIIGTFTEDPGIDEGDVYMLNDSYTAALHPPDVYIISPIFFDQTLHGFVANFVHVNDIGAIDPGGFSPNSRSRFHEGFQTQGLKIVEGGKPRRDVIDTILNQVREPDLLALDLRSQLAANHVAIERMQRLYEEYGPAIVDAVSDELYDQSERLMRERLLELPDGVWRARQYIDVPDRLHRVEVAMTKQGDTLTYDFTGTDPESVLGINNSYWATWGGVLAPLFPLLAWDITWNEGMMKPVQLIAPEHTLVNCIRPGPVSIATVAMIKIANNLSNLLLGKMLDASPKYHRRASAVWDGMHAAVHLVGKQHGGEGFIVSITDPFAGSGGAIARRDGVDIGGELPNSVSRWANVETHELHNPVIYLCRRMLCDSGGPGQYRGGVSHEFAIAPHGADDGSITLIVTSKGLQVPMSIGLSGGYPGCNAASVLMRDTKDADLGEGFPSTEDDLARGEVAQWGEFTIGANDVFYQHYMGGGGYGDPLARDPQAVVDDVALRVVSGAVAEAVYGVGLDPAGGSDQDLTDRLRSEIRSARAGRKLAADLCRRRDVPLTGRRINEYLQRTDDGVQCTWCGHLLGDGRRPWKLDAQLRELPPTAGGPMRDSADGLLLRQFICPSCATQLENEIAFATDELLLDEVQAWPGEPAAAAGSDPAA